MIKPRYLLRSSTIVSAIFWTLLTTTAWWLDFPLLNRAELHSINQRFYWRGEKPPHPDILIIGVDNASMLSSEYDEAYFKENPEMNLLREWPFPRQIHAKLIERLVQAGARVIVFDLLFISPSQKGMADDRTFAAAIQKYADRVVLGANIAERTGDSYGAQLQLPCDILLPRDIPADKIVGVVNYFPDLDSNIRQAETQIGDYFSIDALGIRKGYPTLSLPTDQEPWLIDFAGPLSTFPTIDYYTLFDPKYQNGSRSFYTGAPVKGWDVFKDKIIIVGPKGNFQHDNHLTPFGDGSMAWKIFLSKNLTIRRGIRNAMPGVEIHANAISTLLSGTRIKELPRFRSLFLILGLSIVFAVALNRFQSVWLKLLPMIFFGMCYLIICHVAFTKYRLILPMIPSGFIFFASTMSAITFQAVTEQIEKHRVSSMFQRYVSKNVADQLIKSGQDVSNLLIPRKRTVTILFSDVRDFTTMTEKSEPGPFVKQLNEYLTEMVKCVFNHHGTLDKFIGDAVMAVYGNPTSRGKEEDAWCAIQSALEMREQLAKLNSRWEKEGRPIFRIGIGLNHGDVMAGDIGSSQKAEYGVIGDTVNTAARVEGLTKDQKTDILITDSVYELVKDKVMVEARGEMKVKGRSKAVAIYALKSLRAPSSMA